MTDGKPAPKLSRYLIEKLKAMDLGSVADLLAPVPKGVERIGAADAESIGEMVRVEQPDPTWTAEPMARTEDALYAFKVAARKKSLNAAYQFLATTDWRNLAVPLVLLSPEHMPDPVLKKWHWWRGAGAGEIDSQESARKLARAIVYELEGVAYDVDDPGSLRITFEVETPKGKHTFMSYHGWRGLWAPLYMGGDDAKPDHDRYNYFKVFTEGKIQGRAKVQAYARKMARKHDKVETQTRSPRNRMRGGSKRCHYIRLDRQKRLLEYRDWQATLDVNGCSESEALGRMIDEAHKQIPGSEELPPGFMRQLSRRDKILDAAKQLHKNKKPIRTSDIARMTGIATRHVSTLITAMKTAGMWPYRHTSAGRNRTTPATKVEVESEAVRAILEEMGKLTSVSSRYRVIERVLDGLGNPKEAALIVDRTVDYYRRGED